MMATAAIAAIEATMVQSERLLKKALILSIYDI